MKLFDALLDVVFPPSCVVCGETSYFFGCCKRCEGKLETIEGERCFQCGLDVKHCQCKQHVYHFDGITAPYYNKGFAQQAVYSLKFRDKYSCIEPFSDAMADIALKTFGKENIDLICFVPAHKMIYKTRGFNQSELFAKNISLKTGIPLNRKLLAKKPKVLTQHSLKSAKDRFINVRGAYYATESVKGKKILLVDDIKTTGASLDECARQLKFAGADMVYCVTALITSFDKSKKSCK